MARPRQVSNEDILAAALEVFVEDPIASVARVAEAVGLSQAAIFKRFGSKADLMIAAMAPVEHPPFLPLLESGPDERPIDTQLTEIAEAIQTFLVAHMPRIHALKSSGIPMERVMARFDVPPPIRAVRGIAGWCARAMEEGRMVRTDPYPIAFALMGAVYARSMLSRIMGHPLDTTTDDQHVAQVVQTLWRGLEPGSEA